MEEERVHYTLSRTKSSLDFFVEHYDSDDECDGDSVKDFDDNFLSELGKEVAENTDLNHMAYTPDLFHTTKGVEKAKTGFNYLCAGIIRNSNIISIQLRNTRPFGEEAISLLKPYLENNPVIKTIRLYCVGMDNQVVMRLFAEALTKRSSPVEDLTLNDHIGDDAINEFTRAFMKTPELTPHRLCFDHNCIGVKGCDALGNLLQAPACATKEMSLTDNHIRREGIKALASRLSKRNQPLERLILNGNYFEENGVREFVCAFVNNVTVVPFYLDLNDNHVGRVGCSYLSGLLWNPNCSLKELSLRNQILDRYAIRSLLDCHCERSSPLDLLDLCNIHRMDDKCMEEFVSAFLRYPGLTPKYIDLSCNDIGEEGCSHLARLLHAKNCSAVVIDLEDNYRINGAALRILSNSLRGNKTIVTLKLSHSYDNNFTTDELANAFRPLLCDTDSIDAIFSSNHFVSLGKAVYPLDELFHYSTLNKCDNKVMVARRKIVMNCFTTNIVMDSLVHMSPALLVYLFRFFDSFLENYAEAFHEGIPEGSKNTVETKNEEEPNIFEGLYNSELDEESDSDTSFAPVDGSTSSSEESQHYDDGVTVYSVKNARASIIFFMLKNNPGLCRHMGGKLSDNL